MIARSRLCRLFLAFCALWIFASGIQPAGAQTALINCLVTAEAPVLRSEGAAELVGSIRLACSGGDPTAVQFLNFELFLNTPITSAPAGFEPGETEALLVIDDPRPGVTNVSNGATFLGQVRGSPRVAPGAPGSGNVYPGFRPAPGSNRLSWTGIPFVPAPAGQTRLIRIVNVRADVTGLATSASNPASVVAALSVAPAQALFIGPAQLTVGRVLPSLAATVVEGFATLRFEELFPDAFRKRIENSVAGALAPRQQGLPEVRYPTESGFTPDYGGLTAAAPGAADQGTRFAARISGLPPGVWLIAPNVVVSTPTGGPAELELRRVMDFAGDFSGGYLMPADAPNELVPVVGGVATLVYEVVARPPYEGMNGASVADRFDIPIQVVFAQPVSLGRPSIALGYAPVAGSAMMPAGPPEPRFRDWRTAAGPFTLLAQPTLTYVTLRYTPGDALPVLREISAGEDDRFVTDSVRVLESQGGGWLTAVISPDGLTLRLAASPAGLAQGRYLAAVSFRRVSAPLELVVLPLLLEITAAPELAADRTRLEFRMPEGGPAPPPQTLYLTARVRALDFTASVSTAAGGPWLAVSPSSGSTPKNLIVSVEPRGLAPGTYQGTVAIAAQGAVNSPVSIAVILEVVRTRPFFEPTGVVNAAGYQAGGVSPGEIVTIFGERIGPERIVEGGLATAVAGTRILFDGVAAPIIAVSARQSSVIVPYFIGGRAVVSVEVEFEGARSEPVRLPVVAARPGIFTLDASGRGQGAILNEDLTVNSAANPAVRGSAVAIYFTGAGQTRPAGVDGAVNVPPDLPVPLLPVTVRIGGREAPVEFVGGAPLGPAGLFQVNARVPREVAAGPAVPVEVEVGGVPSQPGVTMALR